MGERGFGSGRDELHTVLVPAEPQAHQECGSPLGQGPRGSTTSCETPGRGSLLSLYPPPGGMLAFLCQGGIWRGFNTWGDGVISPHSSAPIPGLAAPHTGGHCRGSCWPHTITFLLQGSTGLGLLGP